MDTKSLLAKCITLLYRENQLPLQNDSSAELIKTVVSDIKTQDITVGVNNEMGSISALKATVLSMCGDGADHVYDIPSLLQQFKLDCGQDDRLYESLENGINQDLSDSSLKRTIVNLRKSINNHFREEKIAEVLSKAAYTYRFKKDTIKDSNQFIMELTAQLEPLQITSNGKDPAVMSDIDIGDEGATTAVFSEIKANSSNDGLMRTGWIAFNRMLQGGFRRGETTVLGALQHKYKTGLTLSLFKQIALYNKPYMIDVTKKPLLLRISFEDDLTLNLQFLYQSLKEDEGVKVELEEVSNEDMSIYIKQRLQVNGYHIKMMRVDPTQWTYKHICNKIIELEAQGYEVHLLMVDYLMMLPTTGCIIGGPIGTDKQDMLKRMRNFCAAKKIAFITPHQLSAEAKQLLRDGRQNLVKEIVGLGYWEGSKSLDQGMDCEIYAHIEKFQKESYLTIQRGKHRLPTIISEDSKYFVLKFPKTGPIPDDLLSEVDSSFRKVGSTLTNESEEKYDF